MNFCFLGTRHYAAGAYRAYKQRTTRCARLVKSWFETVIYFGPKLTGHVIDMNTAIGIKSHSEWAAMVVGAARGEGARVGKAQVHSDIPVDLEKAGAQY